MMNKAPSRALSVWPQQKPLEGPAMTTLIGTVTLAGTVLGALIGQISTGAEFAGVIIASLVLITMRDVRD
jgi:hypothetical protein